LEKIVGSIKGGDNIILGDCNGNTDQGEREGWALEAGCYLVEVTGVISDQIGQVIYGEAYYGG